MKIGFLMFICTIMVLLKAFGVLSVGWGALILGIIFSPIILIGCVLLALLGVLLVGSCIVLIGLGIAWIVSRIG